MREEPGQLRDVGPVADVPVGGERWSPRGFGAGRDGSANRGSDGEADRVLHLSTTDAVLLGDPLQQVVGGAGTVGADQQITPMTGGDLRDCLAQDVDVVGSGVGASIARAQARGEKLSCVVAPHADRVVPERALICRSCMFLLAVGDHDGGIHIEHDRRSQIPPRTRRCGYSAGQLGPHVPPGAGTRDLDLLALAGGDLIECAPH